MIFSQRVQIQFNIFMNSEEKNFIKNFRNLSFLVKIVRNASEVRVRDRSHDDHVTATSRFSILKTTEIKSITSRKLQRSYYNADFELSTATDNISRSTNFYDIKRRDAGESSQVMSCPYAVLYELGMVFQYYIDDDNSPQQGGGW